MLVHVLVVEDDLDLAGLVSHALTSRGYRVSCRASAEDALTVLQAGDFDIVLSDIRLSEIDGIELCRWVTAHRPELPTIMMTAFGSMDSAIAALRAGAFDFVTKPIDFSALEGALERAAFHKKQLGDSRRRESPSGNGRISELIGTSPVMQELRALIERIGNTESSVLITGESGTGKEVVAHAIHQRSRRAVGPFVPVNCSAVPEPLLESELFGHTRGAYTDAKAARPGLFMRAQNGTLFLDEIGDMPIGLQPKMLRVLQERRVRPVGSDAELACDIRIIAATNRNLDREVDEGKFRQDLYFRINVIQVELPPLRARQRDVIELGQSFLASFAAEMKKDVRGISPRAAEKLLAYDWPGNVRELQNCIERAVAFARSDYLEVDDLPPRIQSGGDTSAAASTRPAEHDLSALEDVERRHILAVLEAVGGNKSTAARVLRLDRKTLYRKLEHYRGEG